VTETLPSLNQFDLARLLAARLSDWRRKTDSVRRKVKTLTADTM